MPRADFEMTGRREFIYSTAAFAVAGHVLGSVREEDRYSSLQREIDRVRVDDFKSYITDFKPEMLREHSALQRLESVFDQVLARVRETKVADRPAVWFLYNMGIVVKTRETCFAIDLMHRRGEEIAPCLDFALITHNHGDHYTEAFYGAMNDAGKPVISNFKDNYGVKDRKSGGYTRAVKTFKIKDVEITTGLADHNSYLVDFTSTFEVATRGFCLYHTGDCSNLAKLNPSTTPDIWCVHPRCGLDPVAAVKKFRPKQTAVLHLNELGHQTKWRWTWRQGLAVKKSIEQIGGTAIVPIWGDQIS